MRDPLSLWEVRVDLNALVTSSTAENTELLDLLDNTLKDCDESKPAPRINEPLDLLANARFSAPFPPPWLDVTALTQHIATSLRELGVLATNAAVRCSTVDVTCSAPQDVLAISVRPSAWRPSLRAMTVSDMIHGDIHLNRWERDMADTPTLQRLKGIKQLGMADYVFPTALHTRFDHSLGTCATAKRIMLSLEEKGAYTFEPGEKALISMAALIHDITHIPFGHTLEDEHPVFSGGERHDDAGRVREFLDRPDVAKALGVYGRQDVESILLADGDNPWQHPVPYQVQIVKNTICADLLDYLRRDSKFCSLKQDYDDRLYDALEIVSYHAEHADTTKPHLAIRLGARGRYFEDILAETLNLLRMRHFLAARVYYNPKKVAFGAMLAKAVRAANVPPSALFNMQDHELLTYLANPARPSETRDLVKSISERQRYVRAYALDRSAFPGPSQKPWDSFCHLHRDRENARAEDEARIVERLNARGHNDLREQDIVIYSPATDMSLKEALALAITPEDQVLTVHALGGTRLQEVPQLYTRYQGLWRFYIFVNPARFQDPARLPVFHSVCQEYFEGHPTNDDVELPPPSGGERP